MLSGGANRDVLTQDVDMVCKAMCSGWIEENLKEEGEKMK